MMELTSLVFFGMVGLSLLLYWFLPKGYQWIVLLLDSLIFYFANATWYTFFYVLASVLSAYFAARFFDATREKEDRAKQRKTVLILTILLNVGILAVLKYLNLAISTFNFLGERLFHIKGISEIKWLAPLAISFYTLQILAYLVDCYGGTAHAFPTPLHLGLYTIYFPLMTSGPICRFSELGTQLFEEHRFDYDRVKYGLIRIAWGFFKKMAISNRAAVIVNQMWAAPETSTGICVWIAVVLFVVQLYTDFSGCMDIALGVSDCFGITLPENFRAPFFSRTVQEFWQRWHITLGGWLRDYVMYPISRSKSFKKASKRLKAKWGKQGQKIPYYGAMLVVWLCMGLWHGNSWKFILGEGIWFWALIVLGQILEPVSKKILAFLHIKAENGVWKAFQMLRTALLFVIGQLFFRADSLWDALSRLAAGFRIQLGFGFLRDIIAAVDFPDLGGAVGLAMMAIGFVAVLVVEFFETRGVDVKRKVGTLKWRWVLYFVLVFVIFLSLNIANQEILYAQF